MATEDSSGIADVIRKASEAFAETLSTVNKAINDIAAQAGASLDRVVHDMVTGPLHLDQTMYRPPADLKSRIAPTEYEDAVGRGMVWGEGHDENAWSLGGVAGHASHAGLADSPRHGFSQ